MKEATYRDQKARNELDACRKRLGERRQEVAAMGRKIKFLILVSEEAADYAVQFDLEHRLAWSTVEWTAWVNDKLRRAGKRA